MNTKILFRTLILAVLVFSFLSLEMGRSQGNEKKNVTIDKILQEVQLGLRTAQTQIVDLGMPPLDTVELTLQTMLTKKGIGGINLYIFTFGSTWEKERSQQLVLKLKPPKAFMPKEVAAKPTLSEELVKAIVAAAEGVQNARQQEPPLLLDTLEVEISFVVSTDVEGGLAAFEILPISIELKGNLKKKAIQKIRVTFKKSS